jgi:poly(3-hydroxybutyrate) depolymerase
MTRHYARPAFNIRCTRINGRLVQVHEEVAWRSPIFRLLHFKREFASAHGGLPILLVAPMSGHYATLLRSTVMDFLPFRDVDITDWQNARDAALSQGGFDLDDYIDTIANILRRFAGVVHVFSVCQPAVPVLASTALLEACGETAAPRTIMLAGGPVDTRIGPTAVNKFAKDRGFDWFRRNVITEVPRSAPGAGRRVYPGFLQLSGFMMMNIDRHLKAHREMFMHLATGDGDSAQRHRIFYGEYLPSWTSRQSSISKP